MRPNCSPRPRITRSSWQPLSATLHLAQLAAQRAFDAAQIAERPELEAFAMFARAPSVARAGGRRRAVRMLDRALDDAQQLTTIRDGDTLGAEMFGLLHLMGAHFAARDSDAAAAVTSSSGPTPRSCGPRIRSSPASWAGSAGIAAYAVTAGCPSNARRARSGAPLPTARRFSYPCAAVRCATRSSCARSPSTGPFTSSSSRRSPGRSSCWRPTARSSRALDPVVADFEGGVSSHLNLPTHGILHSVDELLSLQSGTLRLVGAAAAVYALIEGAEAVGLWYQRRAAASGGR